MVAVVAILDPSRTVHRLWWLLWLMLQMIFVLGLQLGLMLLLVLLMLLLLLLLLFQELVLRHPRGLQHAHTPPAAPAGKALVTAHNRFSLGYSHGTGTKLLWLLFLLLLEVLLVRHP